MAVPVNRAALVGTTGGGMRTVFLGGLDDRVKVAIAVAALGVLGF